jgi:hypothetical protein
VITDEELNRHEAFWEPEHIISRLIAALRAERAAHADTLLREARSARAAGRLHAREFWDRIDAALAGGEK